MPEYGAAVWGAGWVAGEHLKAYQRNPHTHVVAIGSRTTESARAKAAAAGLDCALYDDLERLLANPDVQIVSICTPNGLHAREVTLAAQAAKHIVIEKPPAIELDGLRTMRDAVRRAGVKTIVSFVLRWNPLVQTMKALAEDGSLGRIVIAQADYWHHILPEEWPGYRWAHTRSLGGSAFLAGGCHAVDALRHLVGSRVVEVSAYSTQPNTLYEYAPTTMALLRFESGAIGKASCCLEAYIPYVFNIELLGDRGAIRNNRLYTRRLPGQTDWATVPTILPDSGDVTHHPFQDEIDHFVECLRLDRRPMPDLDDAALTTEVCLAADMSAAEGRPVALPLLPG